MNLRQPVPALPALLMLAALPLAAPAQNADAGRAKAQAVCAACHGAQGVSVADHIPHLAGQRQAYLAAQLRALKSGTRKNPLMNALAAQLSNDEINDLAAYYAAQAPAGGTAKSAPLPDLASSQARLPAGYPSGFTMYQTVNRPDIGQVRYLHANAVALEAARAGLPLPAGSVLVLEQHAARLDAEKKPLTGADGFFQPERLLAYAVMHSGAGWGATIPEMLRNGDWHYAVFNADKQPRPGVNQAECLACHKPLDKSSYVFSWEPLKAAAR